MESLNELVKLAKAGDDAAFADLYRQIYKDMYRYAYYMLNNQQEAEDVVSDTVMDIYQQIKKLRENERFRAWTFKILSNKCKKRKKNFVERREYLETEAVNLEWETNHEYEKKQDLKNAFAELSSEERNVISLAVFGGYKSREIGRMLNIKDTTVRSKLSRALEKMRKRMEVQL